MGHEHSKTVHLKSSKTVPLAPSPKPTISSVSEKHPSIEAPSIAAQPKQPVAPIATPITLVPLDPIPSKKASLLSYLVCIIFLKLYPYFF